MPPEIEVLNLDEVAKTQNGNPVLRSNLFLYRTNRGDIIVDRETCTVLCQGLEETWGILFVPVGFEPGESLKWIANGTIGELQENLDNLNVGFTSALVLPPSWKTDSADHEFRDGPHG